VNIGMSQRMVLLCSACGEDIKVHAADCPQGEIERLLERTPRANCVACRKGDLLPNKDDYFECRTCHVQFSRGLICGGEDPATLSTVLLDLSGSVDFVPAKQMKAPGTGDFPVLRLIEELKAKATASRAARRAAVRTYDRVLARELKKLGERQKVGG